MANNKDNELPPKEAAPPAPVQKKPVPKKAAPPAPVSKNKQEKKLETVEHEANNKTTATKKPVVDGIDTTPGTEKTNKTMKENASLLGRLRRAIGENTRPYGLTPPFVKKGPRTGPKTVDPLKGSTVDPLKGSTVDPTKGSTLPPYKKFTKEEVELDEVSREKLKKYLLDRDAEIETNPNYPTRQKFRSRMGGGGTAIAKLGGRGSKRIKVPATKEEVEQTNEAVLTLSQRIKRAQIMRREAPKIERAREISRTRFAREDQLKNRAEVLARRLVKKKFAGQRGYDYQKLSTSEKMSIDAMVDKKVDLIHRLAKRLFPIVKRKEVARMLAIHTGINTTPGAAPVNIVNSYDPLQEMPEKYKTGIKSTDAARAAHFARQTKMSPEQAVPAPGDATAKTKLSKHTKKYKEMFGEEITGLKKKAEKSGISYGTLKKVYDRGMAAWRTGHRPGTTPQQWAFARVNSYITKGKGTYHGADKDLREQAELNEWYIDTANKYKPSRGDSIVTNNGGRVFGRVERVDETSVYFRNQNDQRVYKTEINNVSKVDHWDGTLTENHSPECSDYEEKPSLSKRMKKAMKKDIKEAQREAGYEEIPVKRKGKIVFRKYRPETDVDKEEGEG
jgi:hypothetical protein